MDSGFVAKVTVNAGDVRNTAQQIVAVAYATVFDIVLGGRYVYRRDPPIGVNSRKGPGVATGTSRTCGRGTAVQIRSVAILVRARRRPLGGGKNPMFENRILAPRQRMRGTFIPHMAIDAGHPRDTPGEVRRMTPLTGSDVVQRTLLVSGR